MYCMSKIYNCKTVQVQDSGRQVDIVHIRLNKQYYLKINFVFHYGTFLVLRTRIQCRTNKENIQSTAIFIEVINKKKSRLLVVLEESGNSIYKTYSTGSS